jgi:hypothetical protein
VKTWFQAFAFKCGLYRYVWAGAGVNITADRTLRRLRKSPEDKVGLSLSLPGVRLVTWMDTYRLSSMGVFDHASA